MPKKRPFPLSWLPEKIQESLYYRYYSKRDKARWTQLYNSAPLKYAPSVQMELLTTDHLHGCIALTGFYELKLTRRITALAKEPGGLLVDVGANAGYYSLLWLANNPTNRCIAIEPSPRNANLLRKNLRSNELTLRASMLEVAAGDRDGHVAFNPGPRDQTGWGRVAEEPLDKNMQVPVTRVDKIIQEPISLLKVDVEGFEHLVLSGCQRLLKEQAIEKMYVEEYKPGAQKFGIAPNEVIRLIRSYGYQATALNDPASETVDWWIERP